MTEKTWIDHEGRLRLEHDENFQMVSPFEVDSIWHLTDSWDIGQACRLILLGYNEDIKRSINYGFEHCPEGSTGRDRASALIDITSRFMTLAKSTIAIGKLKDPDTPANWIEWAKDKGYSVAHLMPANAPAAKDEVRLSVTDQQNNAILKWLRDNSYDPLKLPVPPSGKSGVKKLCRDAVKFSSQSVFNTAWDRLRSDGTIKDEK